MVSRKVISICIPVMNEEASIEILVKTLNKLADQLDHNEYIIRDIIEFYYSELRKTLSNLSSPRINVEGLGHFVAKGGLIRKSIPKYTKSLETHDTSTYGA